MVVAQMSLRAAFLLICRSMAQHATYRFATRTNSFESLVSYLRWEELAQGGDVYLSTKFFTGCGVGQFGGQIHSSGEHEVLFSMWDFDQKVGSTRSEDLQCTRFEGGIGGWPAGTGTACVLQHPFQENWEYRFELTKSSNASGVLWSLKIDDGSSIVAKLVGSIFVDDALGQDCSQLEPRAESFQEYVSGGTFDSVASWRGPFLGGKLGRDGGPSLVVPIDADADCGQNSGGTFAQVSSRIGTEAKGSPLVVFARGRSLAHDCEKPSLWEHGGSEVPDSAEEAISPLATQQGLGLLGSSAMVWVGAIALPLIGLGAVACSLHLPWARRSQGALAIKDADRHPAIKDVESGASCQELALLSSDLDDCRSETNSRTPLVQ